MKQYIRTIKNHPLISGSSIIFMSSFFINGFNYVFNLVMGRLLSVSEYGLLVSLVSIISIVSILQTSLTMLFAKLSAKYHAVRDDELKGALLLNGFKITFLLGLILFFILLIFYFPISHFLHVNNFMLMLIVFLSVFITILYALPIGILQGELRFMEISFLNVLGIICKIGFGIGLVFLGFGIDGAFFGVLLAFAIPYFFSFFLNKNIKLSKKSKAHLNFYKEFKKISAPFLLASIGVIFLQSSDVIFARHFLPAVEAGQFAALSLMGKAIFYVTSPIYFVFFPVIAQKKELKQSTKGTLFLALGIILMGNLFLTLIYLFFPNTILSIFFPQQSYSALSAYLGIYAIYILIFSLAFLLQNYLLSIGKVDIYKSSLLVVGIFVALILFFHASMMQIIWNLIFSSFLLLIFLLVYYIKHERS